MKRYTVKFHVDAPPERVFAYLVDPKGNMASNEDMRMELVKESPDGVGTTYRYETKMFGLRSSGLCVFTEYVPNERVKMEFSMGPEMLLVGGPLSSVWTCRPADGGTDVIVNPTFRTYLPVVNQVGRWFMLRSWQKADLAKVKAEIEKRVPATAGKK